MSISQKAGVYVAIMNVLAEAGVSFDDGQTPDAKELLGKTGRQQVVALVTEGLLSQEVDMTEESRAKYTDEKSMKKYADGLVGNWLKKDTRLNGGGKYEAKNPGSRAGSGDEQIRELKKLRTVKADDAEIVAAIDEAIALRTAEIGQAKAKTITVDASKLPEQFKHLA